MIERWAGSKERYLKCVNAYRGVVGDFNSFDPCQYRNDYEFSKGLLDRYDKGEAIVQGDVLDEIREIKELFQVMIDEDAEEKDVLSILFYLKTLMYRYFDPRIDLIQAETDLGIMSLVEKYPRNKQ